MKKSLVMLLVFLMATAPVFGAQASVSLPSGLKAIQEEAFAGDSAFAGVVELPSGIRSVGSRAFKDTNIFGLKLPAAIRDVGDGILESSGSTYAIVGNASPSLASGAFKDIDLLVGKTGGTVESWANANGIPFFSMGSLFYKDGFAYQLLNESDPYLLLAFPSEEHSGSVRIPRSVYGADVVGVSPYAFTNLSGVTAISLPDTAYLPDETTDWPDVTPTFYATAVEDVVYPPEVTEHPEDTMELAMAPLGQITLAIGETIMPDVIEPPISTWRDYCTWTTSDESVLTVDETGLVTAVGEGSAAITATIRVFNPYEYATPGEPAPEFVYYAVCRFNVDANDPVIDIYENSVTLTVGQAYYPSIRATSNSTLETVALTAQYEDSLGAAEDGASVAHVELLGKELLVMAQNPGTATITLTAEFEGKTSSDTITVKVVEPDVALNFSTLLTYTGYQYNLYPTTELPEGASISFSSENEAIAAVDENGHVTIGQTTGETVITATVTYADGKTAAQEVPVRVKPWIEFTNVVDRELYSDWIYHKYYEDLQPELICDLWPHDAGLLKIWAESSDDNVVAFSNKYYTGYDEDLYVALAKYIGEADVTYYAELDIPAGEDSIPPYTTAEATFHVDVVLPEDMGVYLSDGWVELSLGDTYGIDMWWEGGTAIQRAYLYSDDPEIAAIDSTGVITARGEGMTTIHAVIEAWGATYEATCTVVVNGWEARFEPDELWLGVGESAYIVPHIELAASGKEGMPDNTRTHYTSNNEEIAMVSDAGLVTGLAAGTTVIDMEAFVYNNHVEIASLSEEDMTFDGYDNYSRVRAYCLIHVVGDEPAIVFDSDEQALENDILKVYPRVPVQLKAYAQDGSELENVRWEKIDHEGSWRGIVSEDGELWMNSATSDDADYFYVRATAEVNGETVSAILTIVTKERPAVIEDVFPYSDFVVGTTVLIHHTVRSNVDGADYEIRFVSDDPTIAEALIEDGELYVRCLAEGHTTVRVQVYDEDGVLCNAYPLPIFIGVDAPAPDENTFIAFEYPQYFFSTYDDYNDTWPQVIVEPEELRDFYPITFGTAEKSLIRIDEDGRLRHRYEAGTAEITAQIGDYVGVDAPRAKAQVIIADATANAVALLADGSVADPDENNDLHIEQGDEIVLTLDGFPPFDESGIVPEYIELYAKEPDLIRITDRSEDGKTYTLTALQSGWTDVELVVNLGSWDHLYRFGVDIREPEQEFRFTDGYMIPMSVGELVGILPDFGWHEVLSVSSSDNGIVKASINDGSTGMWSHCPILLEAVGLGRATITAEFALNEEGDTATAELEVLAVEEHWDLVDFGGIPTTMVVGDVYPGHPYVQNTGYKWPILEFDVSDPEKLEVEMPCEENGFTPYLIPREPGVVTLTITAMKEGQEPKTISGDILITAPALKLTPNEIELRPGGFGTVALDVNTDTEITEIVWTTDDAAIAEVFADSDRDFSVQIVAHENANIDNRTLVKAQVFFENGNYAYAAAWASIITDEQAWMHVWLNEGYTEINMEETYTVDRHRDSNVPLVSEHFSSSNPEVASVSATGVVSPKKPGETVITYTAEGYGVTATANMTVVVRGYEASLNANEMHLSVGDSAYLTPTITGGEPDNNQTHFYSTNESVAQVDHLGCVTAVSAGSATIVYRTYVYGEPVFLYCDVHVADEAQKLSINIERDGSLTPVSFISMYPRAELWLTASYDGNLEGELTWASSDPGFVLVDGGFIKVMQRELWNADRSFTTISVTGVIDGEEQTAYLTVETLPSIVNIDHAPNYYEIGVGESTMMQYTVNSTDPSIVINKEFLIVNTEGETETIATVNEMGEITGVSEGVCMVRLNLRDENGALLASGASYVYVGTPIPCPTDENVFFDFEYDLYSFYPCGNESIGLGDRYLRTRLVGKDGYYNADHLLTHGYELVYESSDPEHLEIFDDGNMHIWEDWWTGEVTISAYFRGYEDGPRAEATVKVTTGEPHVLITTPDGETICGVLGLDGVNNVEIGSKITITFADISGMDNVTAEDVEKLDIATCFGDAPIQWTEWDYDGNLLDVAFECDHTISFYLRGDWNSEIWINPHVAPEDERFEHFVSIQPIGSKPMFERAYLLMSDDEEVDIWPAFEWRSAESVTVEDENVVTLVEGADCPFRVHGVAPGVTTLNAVVGLPYDEEAGEEQEFVNISCVIEVVEEDWGLVNLDTIPDVMQAGRNYSAWPNWYNTGYHYPNLRWSFTDESILTGHWYDGEDPFLEALAPGNVTLTVEAWKGEYEDAKAEGTIQSLEKDILVTEPVVHFLASDILLRPGASRHIPLIINIPEDQMSGTKISFYSDDTSLATAEFEPYTYEDGTAVPGVRVTGVDAYNDCRVFARVERPDGTILGATMNVDMIPDWEIWVNAYNWYDDGIWLSTSELGSDPMSDVVWQGWEHNASHFDEPHKGAGTDKAWIEWEIEDENIAYFDGFYEREGDDEMSSGIAPWNNGPILYAKNPGDTVIRTHLVLTNANGDFLAEDWDEIRVHVREPEISVWFHEDYHEVQAGGDITIGWDRNHQNSIEPTGSRVYTDDPDIAYFGSYGRIYGVKPGETTAHVELLVGDQIFEDTARIVVTGPEFSLDVNSMTLAAGDTVNPGIRLNLNGYEANDMQFVSANPDVALVAADGSVYGVAEGVTTVDYWIDVDGIGEIHRYCDVTVEGDAPAYALDHSAMTLYPEHTAQLKITTTSDDPIVEGSMVWSSTDSGIVSVDEEGNITTCHADDLNQGRRVALITCEAQTESGKTVSIGCTVTVLAPNVIIWERQFSNGHWEGHGVDEWFGMYEWYELRDPSLTAEVEITIDDPGIVEYVDGAFHTLAQGNTFAHYTVSVVETGESYTRDLMIRVDQDTMPESITPEFDLFIVHREWRQHYAPLIIEPDYTGVELEFSSGNHDILGFDEGENISEMYFHGGTGLTTVYVGCPENEALNTQFDVLVIGEDEDFYFTAMQDGKDVEVDENGCPTFAPGESFQLDLRNIYGLELPEGSIERIEYRNYYGDDQFTVTDDGLVTITQTWDELEETKNLWATVYFNSGLEISICQSFYVDSNKQAFFFLSPGDSYDPNPFYLAPGSGVGLRLHTNQEWTSGSDSFTISVEPADGATAEFDPDEDGILVIGQNDGEATINVTIPLDDGSGNVTGETMTASYTVIVETPTSIETAMNHSGSSNILYVGDEIELYTGLTREWHDGQHINFDKWHEYSVDNPEVADLVMNIVGEENAGERDWMILRALSEGTVTVTSTAGYNNFPEVGTDEQTMTFYVIKRDVLIGMHAYAEVSEGGVVSLPITLFCGRDEYTEIAVQSANENIVAAELTFDEEGNPYLTLTGVDASEDTEVTVTASLVDGRTQTITVCVNMVGNRVAILTGSMNQHYEEYTAAQMLLDAHGSDYIIHDTYPDNFTAETATTIAQIEAFGADPSVRAIVVCQAVPGVTTGMNNVRKACEAEGHEAPLMIVGVPQEDPAVVHSAVDFGLTSDEAGQADTIAQVLERWGVDVFVHYSFPRHLAMESVAGRRDGLKAHCETLGIDFVEINIPDPTSDGVDAMANYMTSNIDAQMATYADKKVAFFATVCGAQSPLQSAVLQYDNAYYPQPCCPSPYHGFPESLDVNINLRDDEASLRAIAKKLNEWGAISRFSTWESPVNMAIIDVASAYAMAYARGEITDRCDSGAIEDLLHEQFSGATIGNFASYDDLFTILLEPVDFNDYL